MRSDMFAVTLIQFALLSASGKLNPRKSLFSGTNTP